MHVDTDRVRLRLAELGITQRELADRLGVSRTVLASRVEGMTRCPPGFREALEAALGLAEGALRV